MTDFYFKYSIKQKRQLIKQKRLANHSLFEIKEGNTTCSYNSALLNHPVSGTKKFEMRGFHDPEKGPVNYQRQTDKIKVTRIVEQTTWNGPKRVKKKESSEKFEDDTEIHKENPLFADKPLEYVSRFNNPIYFSQAEVDEATGAGVESEELDKNTALYLVSDGKKRTKEVGMSEVDTLF